MIEAIWSLLLLTALARHETRPVALLLAAKWGASYLAAYTGHWLLVPVIDFVAAGIFVQIAHSLGPVRARIIGAAFVIVGLVHSAHWLLWSNGTDGGVIYYWLMLGLFTVKACAVGGSGVLSVVQRLWYWVVRPFRFVVDRAFPSPDRLRGGSEIAPRNKRRDVS